MSDINIGDAIGSVVGSSVQMVSIGGSASHQAQVSAGLKAAGVGVINAATGPLASFAMANAAGYTEKAPESKAPDAKLDQHLGMNR